MVHLSCLFCLLVLLPTTARLKQKEVGLQLLGTWLNIINYAVTAKKKNRADY